MGLAALTVSAGVLVSRLLGQIREIIFAGMLGADATTDQYVAAFRLPDFLNYLLAGGFLTITFIPIFSRYLANDDETGGWAALSSILRPITAGLVALIALGWLAAPTVIELIYPEFTPDQVSATVRLTRIVLPAQFFFVIGALFAAVQYAKGAFLIPSLAPIIYNVGIIGGGVGYALATGDTDPEGFIWGAVAGAFAGNFALQWWGARRVGMRLPRSRSGRRAVLREYGTIAVPLMVGQSIVVLDETFLSTFGDLAGDGVQTQLQYARRTMFVPVGVIAQAAGVAAYPFLARLFAAGRLRELADVVDKALRWVLSLSIVAAGLLAALTVPLVRVLFERFSFGSQDTIATSTALFFFTLSIPIWGALQVVTRAFYARRAMWTPVIVGTGATFVAIPAYWLLQRGFGLRGVAVASVLALTAYTATLVAVWYRMPEHTGRLAAVSATSGRSIIPAVTGGFAAYAASWLVTEALGTGFAAALLSVALGTAAFAAAGLAVAAIMWRRLGPTPTDTPIGATDTTT